MTTMATDFSKKPAQYLGCGPVGYWLFVGVWVSTVLVAPYGIRALTWMLPLSALLVLPGLIRDHDYLQAFARPVMTIGGLFVLYGFISALWALDPGRTVAKASTLLAYLLTGLILLNRIERAEKTDLERVVQLLSVAFLFTCILLLVFRFTGFHPVILFRPEEFQSAELASLSAYNRGISFLVLIGWSLTLFWALRYPRVAAFFPLAMLVVTLSYNGISNQLSVVIGLGALATATIIRQRFVIYLTVLTVLGLLAAPWIALMLDTDFIRNLAVEARMSALHRLDIWLFVSDQIFGQLWTGWGLGGSRMIPGANELIGIYQREQLPSHPHNAALQVWLELGVLGVLMVSGLIILVAARLRRKAQYTGSLVSNRFVGAYGVSALVIALLGYGLFQTIWMATLCFSLLVLIVVLRASENVDRTMASISGGKQ